jgi:ATP phosphoribosyltransferase regulatory subunit
LCCRKQAIALAGHFRKEGMNIILQKSNDEIPLEDYLSYLKRMEIGGMLYMKKDNEIQVINAATGSMQEVSMKELMGR